MIAAPIKMGSLMAQITMELRVTQVKRTRFRLWLAIKIIAFAALICPCQIDVETP